MMFRYAVTAFLVSSLALGDIVISRSVNTVSTGVSANMTLDSGCTTADAYGSNNCDLTWGHSYTMFANIDLGNETLNGNASFTADLKIDGLIPFKFSCPMCGSNCTIKVPVVGKEESFAMPPCPIKGKMTLTKSFQMPSKSMVPIKTGAKGTTTLVDGSGKTIAAISVDATLS